MNFETPKILSPICDFIFKQLFGELRNKRILIAFLKSVLTIPDGDFEEEFEDLSFPNSVANKEYIDGKSAALDVVIRTGSGRLLNIEIQLQTHPAFAERIAAYNDLLFVQTIKSGELYTGLNQTISIVIVDFNFFPDSTEYRHYFCWNEPGTTRKLMDKQEIHTLELTKLPKQPDNVDLCNWLTFFKAEKERDFNMVAQKSPAINEAYGELLRISSDESSRFAYNRWLVDRFAENMKALDAERKTQEREQALQEREQALQEKEQALQREEQALQREAQTQEKLEEERRISAEKDATVAAQAAELAALKAKFGVQS